MTTCSAISARLLAFFSKWGSPQTLVIIDWRVGLVFWVLRLAVVAYVGWEIWGGKQYRLLAVPTGYPTFWFESGGTGQSQSAAGEFCNNPAYDYWYTSDPASYWVEQDAGCTALQAGQIVTKAAQSAFVTTYMKQVHTKSQACSGAQTACEAVGSGLVGRDLQNATASNPDGGLMCTCGRLRDFYVHGADSLQLFVDHSFESRTSSWSVSGTSKRDFSTENERRIRTCVKKCGKRDIKTGIRKCDDACFLEIEPGRSVNMSISDWIALAGHSLDERLEGAVTTSKRDRNYPFRRMVGTSLNFRLRYDGDVNADDTFSCTVEVEVVDGWTSLGSAIEYVEYNGPNGNSEFYDHYRRGVMVQFFPTGQVYRFDFYTLVQTVITGLVLLGVVDTLTGVVAFYCLKESSIYSAAKYETLVPSRRLAKFGLNAAMICQVFDALNHEKDNKISEDELKKAFKGNFPDEEADKLAHAILREAHRCGSLKDEGNELRVQALVELMTTDEVTLADLRKHVDDTEQECCLLAPLAKFLANRQQQDDASPPPIVSPLPR